MSETDAGAEGMLRVVDALVTFNSEVLQFGLIPTCHNQVIKESHHELVVSQVNVSKGTLYHDVVQQLTRSLTNEVTL